MSKIRRDELLKFEDAVQAVYDHLLQENAPEHVENEIIAAPDESKVAPEVAGSSLHVQDAPHGSSETQSSEFPTINRALQRKARDEIIDAMIDARLRLICKQTDENKGIVHGYFEANVPNNRWAYERILGGYGVRASDEPSLHNLMRQEKFVEALRFWVWLEENYPVAGSEQKWTSEQQKRATQLLASYLKAHPNASKANARNYLKAYKSMPMRRFEREIWPNAREKAGLTRQAKGGRKPKINDVTILIASPISRSCLAPPLQSHPPERQKGEEDANERHQKNRL